MCRHMPLSTTGVISFSVLMLVYISASNSHIAIVLSPTYRHRHSSSSRRSRRRHSRSRSRSRPRQGCHWVEDCRCALLHRLGGEKAGRALHSLLLLSVLSANDGPPLTNPKPQAFQSKTPPAPSSPPQKTPPPRPPRRLTSAWSWLSAYATVFSVYLLLHSALTRSIMSQFSSRTCFSSLGGQHRQGMCQQGRMMCVSVLNNSLGGRRDGGGEIGGSTGSVCEWPRQNGICVSAQHAP